MCKPVTSILSVSLAALAILCGVSFSHAGVLNLGAEEIVQAGAGDLKVLGYSVPSYVDWNNDGLSDLIVGEGGGGYYDGKIRLYLNGGIVAQPQFTDFSYVRSQGTDLVVPAGGCLGAFPRVLDFNDDGRKDLIVGRADGTVEQFLNVGTDEAPVFDGSTLLQAGPAGAKTTIDVGNRATLAVTDWNNDGLQDLVLGAYDGRFRLYLNEGTAASPDFAGQIVIQRIGGDLIVPSGRSSPLIMDLDGDGNKDLLAGNTNGEILLYGNQGADDNPEFWGFSYVTADEAKIDLAGSPRSRQSVADWTGDGLPDLLVGASDGNIHLFQSVPEPATLAALAAGAFSMLLTILLRRRRCK